MAKIKEQPVENKQENKQEIKQETKAPDMSLVAEAIKAVGDTVSSLKPKYVYDENGKINWFKMIPLEYLYLNESKKASIEKRLKKPFNEVAKEEALETELIINLAGIRFLLETVGFRYSRITPNVCSSDYAAATCEICFNAGEHNNYREQIYTQCASAHVGNTKSWYKDYLVEAAANRAFCRAVRFYFNLSCVSMDELGSNNNAEEQNFAPQDNSAQINLLQKELDKRKITWPQFQSKLVKDKVEGAENMKSISELPKDKIFEYLERLKKTVEKE